MKKAKLIAFIIRLKQCYQSGWVPFGSSETLGLSKTTYRKLFNEARIIGLLQKANRGYFISNFNLSISRIFEVENSRYLKIYDKSPGSFNELVDVVLISMAHFKIKQQYVSAQKTILENKGRLTNRKYLKALIKESVQAKIRISSRSIGRFIGTSNVTANRIINKMKKISLVKIKKPVYSFSDISRLSNRTGIWLCQREVIGIKGLNRDDIVNPLIM